MASAQQSTDAPSGRVTGAVRAITNHIRTEGLAPGDKLPSESFFCGELSVSRTVVREAFRSLAAMRLIELSAGKRATVAKLDYSAMSPVIEHGVNTEQISIQQIYDVRRTIEARTAALAALHRTNAQAKVLLDLAQNMKRNIDTPEIIMEDDLAFHREIANASRNPIFALIMGAFEGVTRHTWPVGWRSRTKIEEQHLILNLHIEIAEAIGAGDPQMASDRMAQHFDVSVRALIQAGIS